MRTGRKVTLQFKDLEDKVVNEVSFKVWDGLSAFEIWKALPGNEGKTEQEFFASIVPTETRRYSGQVTITAEPIDLGIEFVTGKHIAISNSDVGMAMLNEGEHYTLSGTKMTFKEGFPVDSSWHLTIFGDAMKG